MTPKRSPEQFNQHLKLVSRWCALSTLGSRQLRAAAGSEPLLTALWHERQSPKLPANNYQRLKHWLEHSGDVLFRWSTNFPEALRHIPDSPVALFARGNLASLAQPSVAIVGSRAASHFGVAMARTLAGDLADRGVLVVSGLAQGIDCAAHAGALARSKPSVAIPGSGLENLYPRGHRGLAQQILLAGGVLLSEYAPWVAPHKSSFPARNRLISGLAAGVIVVQGAVRSGSLITARLAAEQGREVMAVPGAPGSPVSAGCNALLRDGAALIESADDVLLALGWDARRPESSQRSTDEAETQPDSVTFALLNALDSVPLSIEQITQFTGLSPADVERALLNSQLQGLVQATPQGYIRAIPSKQ